MPLIFLATMNNCEKVNFVRKSDFFILSTQPTFAKIRPPEINAGWIWKFLSPAFLKTQFCWRENRNLSIFFALLGTFSGLYSETTRASLAKILSVLDASRQTLKPLARSIFSPWLGGEISLYKPVPECHLSNIFDDVRLFEMHFFVSFWPYNFSKADKSNSYKKIELTLGTTFQCWKCTGILWIFGAAESHQSFDRARQIGKRRSTEERADDRSNDPL